MGAKQAPSLSMKKAPSSSRKLGIPESKEEKKLEPQLSSVASVVTNLVPPTFSRTRLVPLEPTVDIINDADHLAARKSCCRAQKNTKEDTEMNLNLCCAHWRKWSQVWNELQLSPGIVRHGSTT